ncbi:MAG TPA: type 3 dihydrofolate reductase [Methylococcaceae bacterium]|nr:type 3 dihydrofolate reductase [Methylococcaceae bacterium]HIB62187.1 type 3 dihydrofolate reductase [Methylococcaceae bacterium]HIN68159.1 type 3 dihydrofolate reductase [Methylococcales bacterium]HIO12170.1 type 3 dihydrofolate reductase [Methylococcales bacterium]HIO44469.1 type 3 dihydrofolate reductase [Methylococcales bacterium]
MKLSIIVAMANNRVIGCDNQMPWHLSADLKKFKKITMGKPILMGRKTFESIGRPLPGRTNIIISSNNAYSPPGCQVFSSIKSALKAYGNVEEIMVIGGSSIYKTLLPLTDRIYLTQIISTFEGDVFFPEMDESQWREVANLRVIDDKAVSFEYCFKILERVNKSNKK